MITYSFHVRKVCRTKYDIDKSLFTVTGDLIIADLYQARILARNINNRRNEEGASDKQVYPGLINGVGLIHEIFHYLIRYYEENENPGVFNRMLKHLSSSIGENDLDTILLEFITDFPPQDVFDEKISARDYLSSTTDGKPNREIILEELILLHLQNENPAAVLLDELFSDKELAVKTKYTKFILESDKFFNDEKSFGRSGLSVLNFLKVPIKENPSSIESQLDFIRNTWGIYIYEVFNLRLLKGKDLIAEDIKWMMHPFGFGKGTPPVPSYEFDRDYFDMLRRKFEAGLHMTEEELRYYHSETEKFTADIDWMPKVVMIAKNAFVWLHQLSAKYKREISRLDQIPDEELDLLAKWKFTSLWLIGIWERSPASKKIKQSMGNPEAAASAYSLFDYVIAEDIGGENSFQNLKDRAWQRGIRMGSDMVPNHTGIYSKWVTEKPDYFISSDIPPYPSYTFHSANLSDDPRVEVRIEDKYYNHSDAAVVFQRKDSYTGSIKYIYHGNDGTHMPWNDTAQLNLLNPEVREALIQTIMHVARKTPIIRFDAAMTLAKKHYQRLWFPIPGSGSGIPSRADYSMTRSQFDEAIPEEFWREVVDRMNSEMPETLLLAEAFWLMESYFVRTLGMHRVYNSAFMHMMMKEENEKYRMLIKNTLSFNPEILKRYVNFMSNPDEETAVNQFGKGDKYFGVSVMLITLPGLPMFGHGQIEGFAEKYGMEYKRSYYDEHVDENLVWRHEAEIFPLMAKRYLFSGVEYFEFYDFIDENGNVVENVFAFSNRTQYERVLVIYNNSYTETKGTLNFTLYKAAPTNEIKTHKKLGEALGVNPDWKIFYIYRDHNSNLEFIISGNDIMEHGIYMYLPGYQYHVFMDFREVYDHQGDYERLRNFLGGRGVPSIQYAMEELKLTPFHDTLKHLMSREILKKLNEYYNKSEKGFPHRVVLLLKSALESINHYENIHFDTDKTLADIIRSTENLREIKGFTVSLESKQRKPAWLKDNLKRLRFNSDLIFPYLILSNLNRNSEVDNLYDKTKMDIPIYEMITYEERDNIPMLKIFTTGNWFKQKTGEKYNKESELAVKFFNNRNAAEFINLNTWEGKRYYNKENFEELAAWYLTLSLINEIERINSPGTKKKKLSKTEKEKLFTDHFKKTSETISAIINSSDEAGYKADELIKLLSTKEVKPASVKKTSVVKEKTKDVKTIKSDKKTVKVKDVIKKTSPEKFVKVKDVLKAKTSPKVKAIKTTRSKKKNKE